MNRRPTNYGASFTVRDLRQYKQADSANRILIHSFYDRLATERVLRHIQSVKLKFVHIRVWLNAVSSSFHNIESIHFSFVCSAKWISFQKSNISTVLKTELIIQNFLKKWVWSIVCHPIYDCIVNFIIFETI